jgi:hypothetical protein
MDEDLAKVWANVVYHLHGRVEGIDLVEPLERKVRFRKQRSQNSCFIFSGLRFNLFYERSRVCQANSCIGCHRIPAENEDGTCTSSLYRDPRSCAMGRAWGRSEVRRENMPSYKEGRKDVGRGLRLCVACA